MNFTPPYAYSDQQSVISKYLLKENNYFVIMLDGCDKRILISDQSIRKKTGQTEIKSHKRQSHVATRNNLYFSIMLKNDEQLGIIKIL